jgi:hypothetical protein
VSFQGTAPPKTGLESGPSTAWRGVKLFNSRFPSTILKSCYALSPTTDVLPGSCKIFIFFYSGMTSSTGGVPAIEIGSLTATSPDESQFIGSSSGIFFVNTVQRAFANSRALSPKDASPEQQYGPVETCIVGHESRERDQHNAETSSPRLFPSSSRTYGIPASPLGVPPSRDLAKELVMSYFRLWHPLFPFLHGPTFVQDLDAFYADANGPQVNTRRKNCLATVFQCAFNIAALDRSDVKLPPECVISSATALSSHLSSLATRHDIPTLQSLLAGQLYLIATMSLHAASTIGALIMRLILHGGFHRCPYRYAQLSTHDADVRKRIFWSAYVTDRYLSQALGLPLGIQDSDIDVCTPGMPELHQPSPQPGSSVADTGSEVSLHLPRHSPRSTRNSLECLDTSGAINGDSTPSQSNQAYRSKHRQGEDALANYVAYGKLTGRALEMFHKSITTRVAKYDDVLELTSDIHSFWNALPQHLQDLPGPKFQVNGGQTNDPSSLGLYFTITYQQLILLINRPFLSLEPSSARFRSSMQACIGASRTVISTLKEQTSDGTCISWPGMLSVTWMSGLILAFACALDIYPTVKGLP